jgi:hypothetical protein
MLSVATAACDRATQEFFLLDHHLSAAIALKYAQGAERDFGRSMSAGWGFWEVAHNNIKTVILNAAGYPLHFALPADCPCRLPPGSKLRM